MAKWPRVGFWVTVAGLGTVAVQSGWVGVGLVVAGLASLAWGDWLEAPTPALERRTAALEARAGSWDKAAEAFTREKNRGR